MINDWILLVNPNGEKKVLNLEKVVEVVVNSVSNDITCILGDGSGVVLHRETSSKLYDTLERMEKKGLNCLISWK